MARRDSNRIAVGAMVLMILAIVLPPFINVSRYKARIVEATSNSLGRPVTIGSISLRLLPQPGFTLENFVVGDDPAFSAEPILRAEEVRATLRMTSLWRGKLEIAKLSLSYPSLNLVRTPDGKVNLESLLARASRTKAAPTTARKPEARPRFPYIEAEGGRINFKAGAVKESFALTETDFALWSEAENQWRMRLEGKPVRTDINISDTGTLRVEGRFGRAENLRDTPVELKASLEHGQLGQFTKLVYGRDRGWRGNLDASITATGTPSHLAVTLDTTAQDFRRYDIKTGEPLRLQARCKTVFGAADESLTELQCDAPAGDGKITLAGDIRSWRSPEYNLNLAIDKVPMNWVTAVARHSKQDLPDDLSASGAVSAVFHLSRSESDLPRWEGEGSANQLAIKTDLLQRELSLGDIDFKFAQATGPRIARISRTIAGGQSAPASDRLHFQPFSVAMGGSGPLMGSGWISREGYSLNLQGEADLARLMHVARALGMGVPHFQAFGDTRLSMAISGEWRGFAQANTQGTLELKSARAEIPGIAKPVQIASAMVVLSAREMRLQNLAGAVDTIAVTGNAIFPRSCLPEQPCASQLNLQFEELDPEKLNALLNPRLKQRPWYRFFGVGSDREESALAHIEATGHFTAKRFVLRAVTAGRVSSDFKLMNGTLTLTNARADMLGGTALSNWTADFSGREPKYQGSGTVTRVNLAQIAALTKDGWGSGTLSGDFKFNMAGWTARDLAASASAVAEVQLRDGALRHISLDHGLPLRFTVFKAEVRLEDGRIHIPESKLQTQNGIYVVSGTATLNRELELRMSSSGGAAYRVTGTLEKPQVVALPAREAEASLKQ